MRRGLHLALGALLTAVANMTICCAGAAAKEPPSRQRDAAAGLGEADALVSQCLLLFALGNTGGAEKACSGALLLDPRRADALKLRGYAYLLQGRLEEAGKDFQAGLLLKPADDQLWAGYGQTLSDAGQFAQAVIPFRKATDLAPQKPAYWSSLCWTQAGSGEKLEAAKTACDTAIRLAPQAAAPYNGRGLVHLRLGQMPKAIADYRHALDLSSEQASALFGLGLARLLSGDTGGSADIGSARAKNPAIDLLFVAMGILPERCDLPGKLSCPPGFPPAPRVPGQGLLARAAGGSRGDILRLAGFRTD